MQLVLYRTLDGDNVINKVLTDETVININLKRDVDIIHPEIILTEVVGVDFRSFNYCNIDVLNKFYFIRNIEILGTKFFKLYLECDYLESFKGNILNSYAKYRRKVGDGDYGEISVDSTGRKIITNCSSDVTLELDDKAIISVMGGFYG